MNHEQYMQMAFEAAFAGMRANKGGPFGAVIALNGKVIGSGCNNVTSTNDPTAHAEIVAIRNACKALGQFHLKGAVLYATCEPCPMCLSAIYWAQIETVYYSATRVDAEGIGFSDKYIYDEVGKSPEGRNIKFSRLELRVADELFNEWISKSNKIQY